MPIRFRCPHCRQMLGISNTRAGAVVDCPGCGRSLQVPQRDGEVAPASQRPESETSSAALRAALDELSMLAPVPMKPPLGSDRGGPVSNNTESKADSIRIVPLSTVARPSATVSRTAAMACCAVAFALGVGLPSLLRMAAPASLNTTFNAKPPSGAAGSATETAPPAQQANDPMKHPEGPGAAGDKPSGYVSGSVTWMTAGDIVQPDASALVILCPARHPGSLRLDGRSLREHPPTADQKAVAAALRQLGASFVRTSDKGEFRLPRWSTDEMQLIVVSKFRARADDEPLPLEVRNTLSAWFESPAAFTGRLMTVVQNVAAARPGTSSADAQLHIAIP